MDEGLGERISTAVSDNIEAIRLSDENSGEGDWQAIKTLQVE